MDSPAETAVDTFSRSFNCSQSVFSAFAVQAGWDEKLALKLASPFGGGVARRGDLCGAVAGGLMALGLFRGAEAPAGKKEIYQLSQEFLLRFEAKHGTSICRELIGCDLSTPAGSQAAEEKHVFTSICPLLVRDAAEIASQLLERQ